MDSSHMHIPLSTTFTAASHANPTPYPEMIRTAITTLGDTNGSSKKAISNFLEQNYPNLPSAHPDLLALHLDILQSHGLLVMHNNKCYKLPVVVCDHSSSPTPQRKRGRPPKIRPEDGPTRGPGRPPKATANIKVLALSDNTGTSSLPTVKSLRRGRGRPRKNAAPLAVGRPNKVTPFAGTVSPDNSLYIEKSSKRRGRPKKNASSLPKKGTSVEDELRSKLKCFQFKVNESLGVIKLHFCNTSPVNVLAAIRELDRIATMDLDAPLTKEIQELPPRL